MSELIVSFVIRTQHGAPYGYRIYEDGKAEQYRVSKLVKNASGTYDDQPVTPGWYPATTLSAAQVESLRQAVDASALGSLPEHMPTTKAQPIDEDTAKWEVMTAHGVRSVTIDDWPPAGDKGAGLLALSVKIGGVVGEALSGNR